MTCTRCGAQLVDGAAYCHMCGRAADWKPARKKRGNRQGTARKRGKTWTGYSPGYSYTDAQGVRHRVRPSKGGFKTKAEALAWAANASPADRAAPTLEALWKVYSEGEMLSLSKGRISHLRSAHNSLLPFMPRRIDTITLTELQEHFNKHYTASSGIVPKDLLSVLYRMAMAANGPTGKITTNVAKYLKLPKYTPKEAEIFSREEIAAVWNVFSAGDHTAAIILLVMYTGMMPAEIIKLRTDMIDTENREIRGAGAKTDTRKKAVIIYPEYLDPVVTYLIDTASADGKVYPKTYNILAQEFLSTLERAGIDNPADERGYHRLTLYKCRHTYGTEAIRAGLPPAVVAKLLRHNNTLTQQRYTHLAESDVREAVNRLKK